jgi:uncharacterized protein
VIDETIVVDGVVHGYNWTRENYSHDLAEGFARGSFGLHKRVSPQNDYLLTRDEFFMDWSDETLEHVLVHETDVDIAVYHSTPLHDYFRDGLVSIDKGAAWKRRSPDRVVLYGSVNPYEGNGALESMEYQVRELGADGIKLYPARYYAGRTLEIRLDDPNIGIPLIERAIELGVKTIAVHKAIPFGPTKTDAYRVNDFDEVCARYPEMNFEIVHAGFAFLDETCFLLGRFPNLYVNLEVTASLAISSPRKFGETIGSFLYWGGEDRIIFASGCSFVHPQPVIDAILNYQMPEDLISGYGLPDITDSVKRKILGANFLRMHKLDEAELRARLVDDNWARARAGSERRAGWSAIREGVPEYD